MLHFVSIAAGAAVVGIIAGGAFLYTRYKRRKTVSAPKKKKTWTDAEWNASINKLMSQSVETMIKNVNEIQDKYPRSDIEVDITYDNSQGAFETVRLTTDNEGVISINKILAVDFLNDLKTKFDAEGPESADNAESDISSLYDALADLFLNYNRLDKIFPMKKEDENESLDQAA